MPNISLDELLKLLENNPASGNPNDKSDYSFQSDYGPLETLDPHSPKKPFDAEALAGPNKGLNPTPAAPTAKGTGKLSNMGYQDIANSERHSNDTKSIAKLLADYDKASNQSKLNDDANGFTEAGMEFGHAFGGDAVDQNYMKRAHERSQKPLNDFYAKQKLEDDASAEGRKEGSYKMTQMQDAQKLDEGNQTIKKNQIGINHTEDLLDSKSEPSVLARQLAQKEGYKVEDTFSAQDILDNLPLIKEDQDQIKAIADRNAANSRNKYTADSAFGASRERNATGIAKTILGSDSRESVAGMRGQELQMKQAERGIHGYKFADMDKNFIPSITSANHARDLAGTYGGMSQIIDSLINQLEKNPRNFYSSDTWNKVKSSHMSIAQALTKLEGNGVMNVNDLQNDIAEMGDPNSLTQWLNQGGLTRLKQLRQNSDTKFREKMLYDGYVPGSMSMSDVPAYAGAGSAGGGGNTLQPTQQALDSALNATHTGIQAPTKPRTATNNGPQHPVAEPIRRTSLEEMKNRLRGL